ncbi:hypothetical protein F4820DRAFT_346716 [Hypoxylon rubiginosum]|uniref:Uncharacterized protein n=1 Tax=Hypoxylon rubiginosum TaxID=110542 RepID=A0ACB9YXQ2_9PEZI|nr:hypothetical protein F4820DRAFT_346716 [Hypoxylon rubiginosum]
MDELLSPDEAYEKLEKRQELVDKYLGEVDKIIGDGTPADTGAIRRRSKLVVDDGERLYKTVEKRIGKLQKLARDSQRFIDAHKDGRGAIDRDRLLASAESMEQSVFDHAAVIIAAKQGNLDFLRNISDDHREALGALESKEIEERNKVVIDGLKANIDGLQADIDRSKAETSSANLKLDRTDDRLHKTLQELEECRKLYKKAEDDKRTKDVEIDEMQAKVELLESENKDLKAEKNGLAREKRALGDIRDGQGRDLERGESRIKELKAQVAQLKDDLESNKGNLDNANDELKSQDREIASLKERISKSTEDLKGENALVSDLKNRVSGLGNQIVDKDKEISTLEGRLETADREGRKALRDSEKLTESLRNVREEKQHSEQTSAARELGLARYFSARYDPDRTDSDSDSDGAEFDRWVPFARAVIGTYVSGGSIFKPTENCIWTLLLTWRREQDQQVYVPHAAPTSAGIIDLAGSLYARALAGDFEEASLVILDSLMQRLFNVSSAPIDLVLLAFETYLQHAENLDVSQAEAPVQLFFFGLYQSASFAAMELSVAKAGEVYAGLEECLRNTPILRLFELLCDGDEAAKIRERASSGDCLFVEDQGVGIIALPDMPGWVFVADFTASSVRVVHNTRGQLVGTHSLRLIAPTSGEDLVVPIREPKETRWALTTFRSRIGGSN